ncbi:MAG: iron-containing alcohol dehydrogenase [Bryobacteraceae bacterium]|jgi:alcohol dehydrogenase class IV
MRSPKTRDLAWLKTIPKSAAVLRASASVQARVGAELGLPSISSFGDIAAGASTLIVAGGGCLMDEAKHFRARRRPMLNPMLNLILVPSIWGSGAETSPITVLNCEGGKRIASGDEFLPDTVVYWPELLATVPPARAKHACGDAWAHTLEAFLSPLASDSLRGQLATLIGEMLRLPLAADPRWFQASARAAALQAGASVGLVHGIAHVLEYPLRARYPGEDWGHARLCAIFLLPVMRLNRAASPKWADLARQYAIDEAAVWHVLHQLFAPEGLAAALPFLHENWMQILRDPCTRTNGALIRPRHLSEIAQQAAV